MTKLSPIRPIFCAVIGLPLLSACMEPTPAADALPSNAGPHATEVAEIKDALDAMDASSAASAAPTPTVAGQGVTTVENSAVVPPVIGATDQYAISGIGFAQIANQPGTTTNQRRLMALRAARLDAMRDLAEQVHGLHLTATTTVGDARVRSDTLTATVDGTIRGARTVRITPKGTDGYEVELSLDADTVAYIVRAARGQI
ncbi:MULTISPECIES: LPP20 family lipoprotein [Rhodobacterales]|uniref:LPP20 family lipoprotein n=1 Tax=Rhodobacterales TaxID=204455 RepID=UPI00201F81D0|nr:LPP20 family lipoprotein [Marivivens sp.]MCL7405046.1 LPP20 family lipoprotein [Marivivens geojensis]